MASSCRVRVELVSRSRRARHLPAAERQVHGLLSPRRPAAIRTVGFDLAEARTERVALVAAIEAGRVPVSPRLRFDTVAGWWLEHFEAKVIAGERHARTLEAHRYQLERRPPRLRCAACRLDHRGGCR